MWLDLDFILFSGLAELIIFFFFLSPIKIKSSPYIKEIIKNMFERERERCVSNITTSNNLLLKLYFENFIFGLYVVNMHANFYAIRMLFTI